MVEKKLKNDVYSDANKTVLSVIIPAYNSEKYLERCLVSVINQTLRNIEIICVNDGSTDSTANIINKYKEKDSRIKVITKKNGGLSSARNAGLRASSSNYICFLDSDDYVIPETYEKCLSKIGDADILIFGTKIEGDYLIERREADNNYYKIKYDGFKRLNDTIRLNIDVSAWNKVYRRSIIEDIKLEFPEGKSYEDYYFYWNYITSCQTAFFDKTEYHRYQRHEGSIMANTFKKSKNALDHLILADYIFHNFIIHDKFKNHNDRNNAIFVNCFWFSYTFVPKLYKPITVIIARIIAKKYSLHGNVLIDMLTSCCYLKIIKHLIFKLLKQDRRY